VVGVIVVAVVAFVIANPGGSDNGSKKSASSAAKVETISLHGGKPSGGQKRITVKQGQPVRLTVTADAPDEVHVHGANIERKIGPGKPGHYSFRPKVQGVFDIESHKTNTKVGKLVVEPK
jgi:FtsP/CotA-like multicopper oxidase with cupredoxin domain